MKKILPIIIVGILILGGLGAVATTIDKKAIISLFDELDQQQTSFDGWWDLGYVEEYNFKFAQSFTPQKNILTRIFLYVGRYGQPYPFQLAIRKELNEDNLTTVSVDYYNIPLDDFTWVEFDFNDIPVIAGETYYMIMSTRTKYTTIYGVGGGSSNPYPNGIAWITFDWIEWGAYWEDHFCFKTYGSGGPPKKPSAPSGNTNGNVNVEYTYTSSTTDPDGDQVYYLFHWGDGTDSGWVGPYSSGDTCSASHKWTVQGTYNIKVKAKDIYDAESGWSDPLSVTMPRDKAITNSLFQQFLQQHPHMFPILRHMLGL